MTQHRLHPRRGTRSRQRLAVAVGVIAAMTLGACAGGETGGDDGGGTGGGSGPVDIRILANDAYAREWQDVLVPEFNEQYPDINVTVDGVPYGDQLANAILDMSGGTPTYDIYLADDPWVPQMAATGGLLDLREGTSDWIDPEYDWDDFHPTPLAAGEWDGAQYGVPVRANLLLMFYNRTLYESAGLPEPTPELTWDQFLEQAPELVQDTDGDGTTDSYAVATYWTRDALTPTIWQTILNSNGGELIDNDGQVAFDTPEAVAALQTHIDLLEWAPPGAETYQFNEPLEAFRQGIAANMFMWGSAYRGSAVDSTTTTLTPDEVGLQVMPVGSAGPGAHRGVWSTTISNKSENPEAAWTFIEWLSSKEGEVFSSAETGSFPSRVSTLESEPAEEWLQPVFDALLEGFDAAQAGEMWRPRLPNSDAVQQVLATETSLAVSGQKTAEAAISDAAAEIEELVNE